MVGTAQFDDSGVTITVIFDRNTDRANLTGQFLCSLIFDATTSTTFGAGAQCVFSDDRTVLVFPTSAATILVGNTVAVLSTTKLMDMSSAHVAVGSVSVCGPAEPLRPTAVISSPTVINTCDNLLLDSRSSFGTGGRNPVHQWALVSPSDPTVSSYLPGDIATATIPSTAIPGGKLSWHSCVFLW